MEVLVAWCGDGQTLPVFSGEAEAEMFVWLGGAFERGWRVRKVCASELVSVLHGPCEHVRSVALDPSPELIEMYAISLVSMKRERFLKWVAGRSNPLPANLAPSTASVDR